MIASSGIAVTSLNQIKVIIVFIRLLTLTAKIGLPVLSIGFFAAFFMIGNSFVH